MKVKAVSRIMLTLLLASMLTLAFNIQVLEANPIPVPSIWMPEEYIDANISLVDGVVQATVNGTYPFSPLGTYYQVMMYYPVPPDADRITVEMNETKLDWTYGNETYPTILGNWPMIIWDIAPVPEYFEIETYYEHPVPVIDGNYTFLYAMGTGKYLDYYAKETIAYVSVNISKHVADRRSLIDVYTIGYDAMTEEWTWNPADYIITEEDETWIVTLTVISEMFHPLIEDLLVTIKSEPTTWTVDDDGPADFSTIQEAVNAANPGDTIYVHNGTYYENVVVNKSISLIGENRKTTIIDGNGTGSVIYITADKVNVTDFTLQNGGSEFPDSGILLSNSDSSCIKQNIVMNNKFGILLLSSSNNNLVDNIVSNNLHGIELYVNSNGNTLVNNIVSNNHAGIYLANSDGNTLVNNTGSDNNFGIVLGWSNDNILINNKISNSGWTGIRIVDDSNGNILTNNTASSNLDGFELTYANNNTLVNNIASYNRRYGIQIGYSDNNQIISNEVLNNPYGIEVQSSSSNNTIYHNNFINNIWQARVLLSPLNTTWDDGYPSGGNYWSDYEDRYPNARELDDSGIWDTPYVIDENNQDNYPLMGPWSPPIERKVGVKVGDWAKYEVAYNYKTNDPNYQPQFADIEYFKTEVLSVTGTNITFQATTYYRNGTETSQFIGMNVSVYDPYNPISAPPFFIEAILFIPANLTVGDTLPLWQHHERYIIKATLVRTYAGAEREVNYVYHRIFFYGMVLPSMERIIFERIMHIFWDRATGVLVEGNETTIITNLTKGYVTKTFTQMTMKETNIWSACMHELAVTSSPMTGITFTINGTPQTTPYTESLLEGSYTLEMPETHGEYVWSHWLEDGDTNRIKTVTMNTDISLTGVFTPLDTTPPTVSIVSPENKTYTVEDVPLTFTVSESTSWIGYSLDGQANITIAGNTTLTGLSDGMHSLLVYASDMTGNMGSSGVVYFTIQTTAIDTTSPSISIVSPENKTYATTDIYLTLTIDEIVSWMAYSLDGQANVTITGNTTLSGLSDESHNLIVYAKDAAGNTGASEMVYFSITTLQPDPFPWWILGAIAGIVVIGIALGTFFLRRRKSVKS